MNHAPTHGLMGALRNAGAGFIAGLVFGGLGGRLAMRIATWMGGFRDSSLGETFGYILAMALLGAIVGVLLGAIPWTARAPWWTVALLTGLLVFVAIRIEGNWGALWSVGNPAVNVISFFLVGAGYGAAWHGLRSVALRRRA